MGRGRKPLADPLTRSVAVDSAVLRPGGEPEWTRASEVDEAEGQGDVTQQGRHRGPQRSNPLGPVGMSVAGVVAGFVIVAMVVFLGAKILGHDGGRATAASSPVDSPSAGASRTTDAVIPVPDVPASVLAGLPKATTDGKVPEAPIDLITGSNGETIEVAKDMPAFARPGADPIAVIPDKQIGTTTWLPVIRTRSGWAQVRLPSRPNGATAWIPEEGLHRARTKWAVTVQLGKGTITVTKGGVSQGTWSIGQGKPATPTPVGQTFLVSGFVDPTQSFSPVIYALGAHSDTLDTYGGGPGTVAVHGWPTQSGREGRVSHGCVRVPEEALQLFAKLPTATPVDVVA